MACSFGRSRAVVKGWQEHSLLPAIASQQMPKAGRPWVAMDDHGWPGNACQCLAMLGYAGPTRAYSSILELLMAAYGCLALPAMLCSALQCYGGAWRCVAVAGQLETLWDAWGYAPGSTWSYRVYHGLTMTHHHLLRTALRCAITLQRRGALPGRKWMQVPVDARTCQNHKDPRITVQWHSARGIEG